MNGLGKEDKESENKALNPKAIDDFIEAFAQFIVDKNLLADHIKERIDDPEKHKREDKTND